jgi:beta-carotene hydroxylase
VLAWNGLALEALLLWWLPYHLAITYIVFFLSWAPHHPMQEQGRYRDTRSWKSRIGSLGSMWMEFHIVHHLHPYIPLIDTRAAYRELRPILAARGCELGEN